MSKPYSTAQLQYEPFTPRASGAASPVPLGIGAFRSGISFRARPSHTSGRGLGIISFFITFLRFTDEPSKPLLRPRR